MVPDVGRALIRMAGLARRRLPEFVVGITGSVGKTTTEGPSGLGAHRAVPSAASARSFNNELGVPLTLANAREDTEVAVVEMGARGHGRIALLCSMAHPTVGVVTAIQAVHTEHMGGEHQIAVAKRELVEHLPPTGLAVCAPATPAWPPWPTTHGPRCSPSAVTGPTGPAARPVTCTRSTWW